MSFYRRRDRFLQRRAWTHKTSLLDGWSGCSWSGCFHGPPSPLHLCISALVCIQEADLNGSFAPASWFRFSQPRPQAGGQREERGHGGVYSPCSLSCCVARAGRVPDTPVNGPLPSALSLRPPQAQGGSVSLTVPTCKTALSPVS